MNWLSSLPNRTVGSLMVDQNDHLTYRRYMNSREVAGQRSFMPNGVVSKPVVPTSEPDCRVDGEPQLPPYHTEDEQYALWKRQETREYGRRIRYPALLNQTVA